MDVTPPTLAARLPKSPTEWMIVGGIAAAVVLAMIVSTMRDRARRRKLAEAFPSLGVEPVELDSPQAEYIHEPQKGETEFTLRLCAVGMLGGLAARIAEYTFDTGSGKSRHTWPNLQASLECPLDWPRTAIFPARGFLQRPIELFGSVHPAPNQTAFGKRWSVTSDDAAFRDALLTPELGAFLLKGHKTERWSIGDGWLTCTWKKPCGVKDLADVVQRAQEMLRLAHASV
jgi:hypothetical protein